MTSNTAKTDVNTVVFSIIKSYTIIGNSTIGMKTTFDSLVIGQVDLELIRLDLEGQFNINLRRDVAMQWKLVKQVVGSVKRQLHRSTHDTHKVRIRRS